MQFKIKFLYNINLVKWKHQFHNYSTNIKLNKLLLQMPQDRKHIPEAQKRRLKIKEKSLKYSPGTVDIQVLGSGAYGTPASVYLFTDHTRYLFNCGEGTQRLAHEHKTKLARLEHIFMTRTSWDRIGGLPGLSLTVQDAGVPELTLHGPSGLDELFGGMRRFVVLKHLKINSVNCEEADEYDDAVMNVKYIRLKKKNNNKRLSPISDDLEEIEVDNTDYFAYEDESLRSESPIEQMASVTSVKREENTVIAYICKLKPKQGALNLEKCVEKGVPPGPLLGQLKNGNNVTLPNGTIVHADEVRAPTDPGPVFIFLDIPSEDYLESLEEAHPIFSEYQSTTNDEKKLASVVIHFSPQNIIESEIYQKLIERFTPSTQHLVLNSTNQLSGNIEVHRIQWQLNQLNPFVFPILKESSTITHNLLTSNCKRRKYSNSNEGSNLESLENNTVTTTTKLNLNNVKSLTCYHLRPKKGLDRDFEPSIEPLKYIEETHAVEGFTVSLEKLKRTLENYYDTIKMKRSNDFPKIIFLGTGSCVPNKARNVSAILIHTNENSCILLDCGEGTLGQIIRFYGKEEANEILKKIKIVYISHLHADHHIGLIGILNARQQLLSVTAQPLLLLAPKQIQSWLHFYSHRIEKISQGYNLISNDTMITEPLNVPELHEISINSISTCLVHHCPYSYGVSIELNNTQSNIDYYPIKITYSGDTMPCDTLVNIGKNSTILIHEATMEDELKNEARFKMHSTVSQAIEQGNKMNAKYTILTHFSQRYAKLPRIEEKLENNSTVGIAFDNMEVTLSDLDYLHLMYPTLKIMFNEHCELMEQRAYKRSMRKERKQQASFGNPPSPVKF